VRLTKEDIFFCFNEFQKSYENLQRPHSVVNEKTYSDVIWSDNVSAFHYYRIGIKEYGGGEVIRKKCHEVEDKADELRKKSEQEWFEFVSDGDVQNLILCYDSLRTLEIRFEKYVADAKTDRVVFNALLDLSKRLYKEQITELPTCLTVFYLSVLSDSLKPPRKNKKIDRKYVRNQFLCVLISALKDFGIKPDANSATEEKLTGIGLVTEWYKQTQEDGLDVIRGRAVRDVWYGCTWKDDIENNDYSSQIKSLSRNLKNASSFGIGTVMFPRIER